MALFSALSRARALCDWLTLADYHQAKEKATKRVITRLARGNVSFQNGWMLDDDAVSNLKSRGDAALARLNRLARQR